MTKQQKAKTIEHCTIAIAEHCGVDPLFIIDRKPRHGNALQDARGLLTYHLHDCGMSLVSIARLLGRSVDNIRRLESAGAVKMMGDDRQLIAGLPRVEVAA